MKIIFHISLFVLIALSTSGCQWSKNQYNKWFAMDDSESAHERRMKMNQEIGEQANYLPEDENDDLPVDDVITKTRIAKILKWENRKDLKTGYYFQTSFYVEYEDTKQREWIGFPYVEDIESTRIQFWYNQSGRIVEAMFVSKDS